jgi:hypothetical protein
MLDTPRDALERFITQIEAIRSPFEPLFKKSDEALDAGVAALRPFLANPTRYEQAVRVMLEGIVTNAFSSSLVATIPIFRSRLFKLLVPEAAGRFEKLNRAYLDRLSEARDDLLKSLTPGRLQISIFPPKVKDAEQSGFRLVEFQLNIDISADSVFLAEGLSLDFYADGQELQFSTVISK